jgi:hypothetical protein
MRMVVMAKKLRTLAKFFLKGITSRRAKSFSANLESG